MPLQNKLTMFVTLIAQLVYHDTSRGLAPWQDLVQLGHELPTTCISHCVLNAKL